MWVTKLLFLQQKLGFFARKRPNLAQNWHFWSIWARPCRLIQCPVCGSAGGCGARAVSRKTPIYFMYLFFCERTNQHPLKLGLPHFLEGRELWGKLEDILESGVLHQGHLWLWLSCRVPTLLLTSYSDQVRDWYMFKSFKVSHIDYAQIQGVLAKLQFTGTDI